MTRPTPARILAAMSTFGFRAGRAMSSVDGDPPPLLSVLRRSSSVPVGVLP